MRSAELPEPICDVTWRRGTAADADRFFALILRIDAVDDPGHPLPRGEFDAMLTATDPAEELVFGEANGRLAAFSWRRRPGGGPVRLIGGVAPERRGAGIGRRLLHWQTADARTRVPDAASATVRQAAASDVSGLARRAGFTPQRVFLSLRRPAGGTPGAALPASLRAVHFEPEFDEAVRVAKNEAFLDHWQASATSPEEWRLGRLGSALRRDLSRIAVAEDGEVVGFALLEEVDGPEGDGYIPLVGTVRSWRGRGVARSLLTEVVGGADAVGLPGVALDVDAASGTGAVRLYASLGFAETSRATIWSRTLQRKP